MRVLCVWDIVYLEYSYAIIMLCYATILCYILLAAASRPRPRIKYSSYNINV